MEDRYAWWRNALELKSPTRQLSPSDLYKLGFNVEEPQVGFYKKRIYDPEISPNKRPVVSAAIWKKEGEFICAVDGFQSEPIEEWQWMAKNPITEDEYRYYEKHGVWPEKEKAA